MNKSVESKIETKSVEHKTDDESVEHKLDLGTKFRVADIDSTARYDVHWLERHKTKIYFFVLINGIGLVVMLFPMI